MGTEDRAEPGRNLHTQLSCNESPEMFVNKFVYSQQGTFQTDLFEDAFNYCHVDNEESSPSSTHKLNCTHTPSSLLRLTSR